MKKNLIALAVAAAALPFAAQAEVTISGALQAELISMSGDGSTEGLYMDDGAEGGAVGAGNASFIKFMSAHDLGGGLTAIAMANTNLDVTSGTGVTMRDGFVALKGDFGLVLMGRVSTSYKSSTVKWDPFLATSLQARGSYGMSALHNGYVGNVLAYDNTFGQVHVQLAMALDEAPDGLATPPNSSTVGNHALTGFITMPIGPVELAVAFIDVSEMGNGAKDASATKLGVKYSAGDLTAAVQVESLNEGITGTGDTGTVTYGTVSYTVGANTFALGVGAQDMGATNTSASYLAAGIKHSFGKKVTGTLGLRNSDHDVDTMDSSVVSAGLKVAF
jgi:predicted porin